MPLIKCALAIFLIGTIVVITSCSSTTQSSRYNRPTDTSQDYKNNGERFSSSNDPYSQPEFDEYPVEEIKVDKKEYIESARKSNDLTAKFSPKEKILAEVIDMLNTPYEYGGNDKDGIDCSAFTKMVMNNSLGFTLPRTASEQYQIGKSIFTEEGLKFGDLVFFNTTKRAYPGHVGIYLGDNLFAHASRSKGVIVSSIKNKYYKDRFVGGRRIKSLNN